MKAIIPVAGTGTKLRPHTYTQPKALIPIAGKPILAFIIDEMIEAGLQDFIFIIGYLGDKIRDFVEKKYPDINKKFVEQTSRDGIGHAIWHARHHVDEAEPVFIALGDSVFDLNMKEIVSAPTSLLCVKKVDDPRTFGVVEMEEKGGLIHRLIEKPQIPKSNLALVGLYKINESTELFDALDFNISNKVVTRGEIQLTDALMRMIEKGIVFKGYKVNNWFDCGRKSTLLDTNAILLKKMSHALASPVQYENSIIIDPVSISEKCRLNKCIVGPNVTIGENTVITSSIIKDSIIGSNSEIEDVLLHHSLVGNDATIRGMSQTLNLGDDAEIDMR
ncbi:MAG: NTP transferase domain-containing protein [Chitinophagales bacterium]|jgi:glucose-1-phosphate thymidylyltransferase|nr:NTP transferase domain-containing protein [Chitinophagales bacterium]